MFLQVFLIWKSRGGEKTRIQPSVILRWGLVSTELLWSVAMLSTLLRVRLWVEAWGAEVALSSRERAKAMSPSRCILLSASWKVMGSQILEKATSVLSSSFLCAYVTFLKSFMRIYCLKPQLRCLKKTHVLSFLKFFPSPKVVLDWMFLMEGSVWDIH